MKKDDLKNEDLQEDLGEEIVFETENELKSSFSNGGKEDKLKQKIKELEKERKEYLDGWQRSQADIANLKKRHDEEKKIFTNIGKESLLIEIIPVLDNFEAAFSNKDAWEKTPAEWRAGIEYIYTQFQNILENNGVSVYGEVGDAFDEKMHVVLDKEDTQDKGEKDKVSFVVQKGYSLKGRVVREAKVKIFS